MEPLPRGEIMRAPGPPVHSVVLGLGWAGRRKAGKECSARELTWNQPPFMAAPAEGCWEPGQSSMVLLLIQGLGCPTFFPVRMLPPPPIPAQFPALAATANTALSRC